MECKRNKRGLSRGICMASKHVVELEIPTCLSAQDTAELFKSCIKHKEHFQTLSFSSSRKICTIRTWKEVLMPLACIYCVSRADVFTPWFCQDFLY